MRRPLLNSLNVCDVLPLAQAWRGDVWNGHLDAPCLLQAKTEGSTPFALNLHQGDVGHTLVAGPTGAGKSTLLNLLAAQWTRYEGAQVFLFDKGGSCRTLTYAMGGDFYDLGVGGVGAGAGVGDIDGAGWGPLGFQPLAEIDDAAGRTWAAEWVAAVVEGEQVQVDAGMSSADIAARFGIGRQRVEQRMALGRIAPDLLDELRKGAMSAGLAQVLTLTADHERQREAWRQCRGGWNAEVNARRLLTETATSLDDPLLRLVGRDAYEKAGGAVRVDLFSKQEEGEGFAEDAALVRRLATERLDAEAERVKADGWAFAVHELQPDADPYAYRRDHPERRELTPEEQGRADEIEAELTALDEEGWGDDTPEGRETGERYARLEAEHEAMEAGREQWTAEQKGRCGVFVCVDQAGAVQRRAGLVDPAWERKRAEERRRAEEQATAADKPDAAGSDVTVDGPTGAEGVEGVELSRALVTRLTKARTEALRASMIGNPAAADLFVAYLAERLCYATHYAGRDPLPFEAEVRAGRDDFAPGLGRTDPARGSHGTDAASEAQAAFYDALQAWRSRMPQTPDALPAFVAELSAEDKTGLLALLAAASVNTVAEVASDYRNKSDASVGRAAAFVGCDVRAWWKPTAESVFSHMTRAGIAAAVAEALPDQPAKAAALAEAKKADAAAKAEALVKETDWLPLPLRIAHHPLATRRAGETADAPAAPMKLAA